MAIERENALTCATVGIDGTGKSTSLNLATDLLSEAGVDRIAFLGRKPFSVESGKKKYHLGFLRVLDYLHEIADRTGNKDVVLWTNLAHIYTQGRLVEPYMVHRVKPALILSPRDYLVDSTVYADIYWQELSRQGIDACRKRAETISGMEPRNLLFFLTAPTDIAMQRIQRRLSEHSFDRETHHRPKWAHMHEKDAALLEQLRVRYYPVLQHFLNTFNLEIHEIDTTRQNAYEVAGYISDIILERISDPKSSRRGNWIKSLYFKT